ncbi:MAG: dicarboxylate/amino acid:cation symporter [Myxococcales bacterium]|nr:dicarboxylate/amino acid:cation symporter [Myxococcales bacterium]
MGDAAPRGRWPLYVQILAGVVIGIAAAKLLGRRVEPMANLGLLVIRALKALATPLILFAVLDAFARTKIEGRQAARLVGLSLLNAVVAIAIGLGVSHLMNAGAHLRAEIGALSVTPGAAHAAPVEGPSLNPLVNLARYIPESVVEPFVKNNVIAVVLIAVALGAAWRALRSKADPETEAALQTWARFAHGGLALFSAILHGVVRLIPVAVSAVVAGVVARTGVGVFATLLPFLATVFIGFILQGFVWYGLLVWAAARRNPVQFWRGVLDPVVTALSCGSSLATLPVTLKALDEKLKVSPASARLAACVGTNLNHDGIILYEAAAAIFVSQAMGQSLSLGQQVGVALAAVMAGVGIAGVPEAGLITLPLVLGAAGIPDHTAAAVIPLLLPLDWIVGRGRAATNVLSDMTVATVLDRWQGHSED